MITVLQTKIKEEDLKVITKTLHPDLPEGWEAKFSWHCKYTWVCVSFRVKGYGSIDFAIDNHHQTEFRLYGPKVTKSEMKTALEDGGIDFNVWRFSTDKLNREREIIDNLPKEPCILEAKSYIKARYPLPSVNEYFHIYYED